MQPLLILATLLAYFALLFVVARWTSRNETAAAGDADFFLAGRAAPWYVVAFGMIGTSLSGVTFISVPGWVGEQGFTYMQMVVGYLFGYLFIAGVLLPLYYRLGLTSIYTYLGSRLGPRAYLTGAWFFLLSRIIGSAFRLYLVVLVLETFVLEPLGFSATGGFPWGATAVSVAIIALIWLYTRTGGMKTIVWTDTLQTAAMLGALAFAVWATVDALGWNWSEVPARLAASGTTRWWVWDDWAAPNHALKHLVAGACVAVAMTGLDQDMMQKNLACRNLRDAQINMLSFSTVLIGINLLFLVLGALLYSFWPTTGLPLPAADALFPTLALHGHLGPAVAVLFLIGLLAAALSSADGALTALTTSFCVDVLDTPARPADEAVRIRKRVHVGMAGALVVVMVAFRAVADGSVVAAIFTAANYTYGPLLGMFGYGLISTSRPADRWIPVVAVLSPFVCFVLETVFKSTWGFSFGFALLPVNGALTFLGLALLPRAR
jgi:Na+/proline symporter